MIEDEQAFRELAALVSAQGRLIVMLGAALLAQNPSLKDPLFAFLRAKIEGPGQPGKLPDAAAEFMADVHVLSAAHLEGLITAIESWLRRLAEAPNAQSKP